MPHKNPSAFPISNFAMSYRYAHHYSGGGVGSLGFVPASRHLSFPFAEEDDHRIQHQHQLQRQDNYRRRGRHDHEDVAAEYTYQHHSRQEQHYYQYSSSSAANNKLNYEQNREDPHSFTHNDTQTQQKHKTDSHSETGTLRHNQQHLQQHNTKDETEGSNKSDTNSVSTWKSSQLETNESDEEAAATALLLAAGGPRREEVEKMKREQAEVEAVAKHTATTVSKDTKQEVRVVKKEYSSSERDDTSSPNSTTERLRNDRSSSISENGKSPDIPASSTFIKHPYGGDGGNFHTCDDTSAQDYDSEQQRNQPRNRTKNTNGGSSSSFTTGTVDSNREDSTSSHSIRVDKVTSGEGGAPGVSQSLMPKKKWLQQQYHTVAKANPSTMKTAPHQNLSSSDSEFTAAHFPSLLHQTLSNSEYSGIVLEWLPHGQSWRVLRWDDLSNSMIPALFPELCSDEEAMPEEQRKCDDPDDNSNDHDKCNPMSDRMNNFLWYIKAWGFEEVREIGPDMGSYRHDLFVRSSPHLCRHMYFVNGNDAPMRFTARGVFEGDERMNTMNKTKSNCNESPSSISNSKTFSVSTNSLDCSIAPPYDQGDDILSPPRRGPRGRFSMLQVPALNPGFLSSPHIIPSGVRRVVSASPPTNNKKGIISFQNKGIIQEDKESKEASITTPSNSSSRFLSYQNRTATSASGAVVQSQDGNLSTSASPPPPPRMYNYRRPSASFPFESSPPSSTSRRILSGSPTTPMQKSLSFVSSQISRNKVEENLFPMNSANGYEMPANYQTPPDRVVSRDQGRPPPRLRSGRGGARSSITPARTEAKMVSSYAVPLTPSPSSTPSSSTSSPPQSSTSQSSFPVSNRGKGSRVHGHVHVVNHHQSSSFDKGYNPNNNCNELQMLRDNGHVDIAEASPGQQQRNKRIATQTSGMEDSFHNFNSPSTQNTYSVAVAVSRKSKRQRFVNAATF